MRYLPQRDEFEERLVAEMKQLAGEHPFWGHKKIHQMLLRAGWKVNRKRVQRLWRLHGFTIPRPQASGKPAEGGVENAVWKRQAIHPDHIWAYDFVSDRTRDGRPLKILNIVDEFTREVIYAGAHRSIGATKVREILSTVVTQRRRPQFIRSDNGREFIAETVKEFLSLRGITPLYIEKGRPQQNGICERTNGLLRQELLNVELFGSLTEANLLISEWASFYNAKRPHGALAHMTPTEFRAQYRKADTAAAAGLKREHREWTRKREPVSSKIRERLRTGQRDVRPHKKRARMRW